MDNNQFMTMLEQYFLGGKDIRALYEDCTALTAGGKTPLGLNQWVKSDKPLMEDFNEDNRIIDQTLRELAQKTEAVGEECSELDARLRERPEEFALALNPVLAPYSSCKYAKDILGRVFVHIGVKSTQTNADIIPNMAVASLPSGFRPLGQTTTCGVATTENGELTPIFLHVHAEGQIIVGTIQKLKYLSCEISFLTQ